MMRRLGDRLRVSRSGRRHRLFGGARDEYGMPWTTAFARHDIDAEPRGAHDEDGLAGLVQALHRVADTFETVAEDLELDRQERRARLDTVEVLLRDLVTGLAPPTAVPPIVVGGSIDPEALGGDARDVAQIDLSDPAIELENGDDASPAASGALDEGGARGSDIETGRDPPRPSRARSRR
jgi:hypothetical protein